MLIIYVTILAVCTHVSLSVTFLESASRTVRSGAYTMWIWVHKSALRALIRNECVHTHAADWQREREIWDVDRARTRSDRDWM